MPTSSGSATKKKKMTKVEQATVAEMQIIRYSQWSPKTVMRPAAIYMPMILPVLLQEIQKPIRNPLFFFPNQFPKIPINVGGRIELAPPIMMFTKK